MKKFFGVLVFFVLVLAVYSCSMSPGIVRQVLPIEQQENGSAVTNRSSTNRQSITQSDVTITLEYIDRSRLYDLSKINRNQYSGDSMLPLLSLFLISIENGRQDEVSLQFDRIVLVDGQGDQFLILDFERFSDMNPALTDGGQGFGFIFDQFYYDWPEKRTKKSRPIRKSLFRGGTIYGNAHVQGILAFQRVSELVREMKIIIPEVLLLQDEKEIGREKFVFYFYQTVQRAVKQEQK